MDVQKDLNCIKDLIIAQLKALCGSMDICYEEFDVAISANQDDLAAHAIAYRAGNQKPIQLGYSSDCQHNRLEEALRSLLTVVGRSVAATLAEGYKEMEETRLKQQYLMNTGNSTISPQNRTKSMDSENNNNMTFPQNSGPENNVAMNTSNNTHPLGSMGNFNMNPNSVDSPLTNMGSSNIHANNNIKPPLPNMGAPNIPANNNNNNNPLGPGMGSSIIPANNNPMFPPPRTPTFPTPSQAQPLRPPSEVGQTSQSPANRRLHGPP